MSKPRTLPSPDSFASRLGADGSAGRPGENAPGPGRGRLARRRDPARGLHHQRLRQAALGGRRDRGARGSGPAAGRGRRRSRSSSSARTRETERGPRARPRRGDPATAARSRAAIARSCAGSRYENSRQIATDSASDLPDGGDQALDLVVAQRLRPRRRPRSARGRRSAAPREPAGSASAAQGRYRCGRSWRAISCRSVNPSVAISAVRAPRSSSSAFVPTVIPWAKPSTAAARRRPAAAPPSTAASTPCDWSSGVVGAFAVCSVSPSKTTASVKVPPTSTPSSTPGSYRGPRAQGPRRCGGQRQRSLRSVPSGSATRWTPSSAGSGIGKSERRWAPRDSRRSSAVWAISPARG